MLNVSKPQTNWVQRRLPWVIAAVFLLVYLITLVRWGTITGLPHLAKVTGWDWRPSFSNPLLHLFTMPVRWLPDGWQLTGLNVLGALFSAGSLGLLARSVALLPQDRTKLQRQLERSDYSFLSGKFAWIPPILATTVCGLQLTFWENAIQFTGESLDLLLFAFVIWNLLEFRIDERRWRMPLTAFVFGASMANNFAMVAFFPAFMVAIVWFKGMQFFQAKFILTMLAAGLLGTLFYLVQPFLVVRTGLTHHTFWEALLVNLGHQKSNIAGFPRYLILITGLTSIVPVLFMGIRWPAQFGDTNPVGARLTTLMTHLIHAVFLSACVYVAYDPPFSPRHLGGSFAFLPFYFLGALSTGYFAGYFILICGAEPQKTWERPSQIVSLLNKAIVALLIAGSVVIPLSLVTKNYPSLSTKTARELDVLSVEAVRSLPEGHAVVLADDPLRLFALEAALDRQKPDHGYVMIDTSSLLLSGYHRAQRRRYGDLWPDTFVQKSLVRAIPQVELQEFVVGLRDSMPLVYLHPSFGYFFERLYARPHHNIYLLEILAQDHYLPPPVDPSALVENENFWNAYVEDHLQSLIAKVEEQRNRKDRDPYTAFLGDIHSVALNAAGVTSQRAGHLLQASNLFHHALLLNPQNATAFINRDFNRYLQAPTGVIPVPSEGARSRLENAGRDWNALLSRFGPVDEPNSCYLLAQVLLRGNNYTQAVQEFTRSLELNPDFFPARLALANAWVQLREPQKVMAQLKTLRESTTAAEFEPDTLLFMMEMEAWAKVLKGETGHAISILKKAQETYPNKNGPFSTLANIYMSQGRHIDAIAVYLDQLQKQPRNTSVMVNLSAIKIRFTGELQDAIDWLTKALAIDAKNKGALMNRAIAYLNLSNIPEAKQDYQRLKSLYAEPVAAVEYGLAEVYWREKDYEKAREHYKAFLEIAPPNATEVETANQRLQDIKNDRL